ncbi:MAG: hypothetical protein CML65_12725 [Rhodobacteraceae bacterium]|nr:hypothetical protein [Paracoccaceae bacterium]
MPFASFVRSVSASPCSLEIRLASIDKPAKIAGAHVSPATSSSVTPTGSSSCPPVWWKTCCSSLNTCWRPTRNWARPFWPMPRWMNG